MSYYPDTHDLSVLRHILAYSAEARDCSLAFGYVPTTRFGSGIHGARDEERQHGIGFISHGLKGWNPDPHASRLTEARREAAAMRSRAYARDFGPEASACEPVPGRDSTKVPATRG